MRNQGLDRFWQGTGGSRSRFVDEAFAAVAAKYDRLVRLFSGGLDRRWRRLCMEACEIGRGGWVLDCATGTGALALAAYLPRTIEVAPSMPELVEAVESAGLHPVRIESLFAQVVWLVVAMKPPRARQHEMGSG